MTRILDALASDRLVSRNVEERDARRQIVRITAEGRRNVSDAAPRLAEPLRRAFSGLSAEEFSQLDHLLRKVIKSFDQSALPLRASA